MTFGSANFGRLGLGTTEDTKVPLFVSALSDIAVTNISCGGDHTLAVSNEGKVYGWGWNEKVIICHSHFMPQGQLGTGNNEDVFTPQEITALRDVKDISLGTARNGETKLRREVCPLDGRNNRRKYFELGME